MSEFEKVDPAAPILKQTTDDAANRDARQRLVSEDASDDDLTSRPGESAKGNELPVDSPALTSLPLLPPD